MSLNFKQIQIRLLALIPLLAICVCSLGCPDRSHLAPVPDYSNQQDPDSGDDEDADDEREDEGEKQE